MSAAASLISLQYTLPFQDHYLRVRTLRYPDATADARPWLVFLHDSLGSIQLWRDFPAQVASAVGCHAMVYDRRGYGESAPFGPALRTPAYLEEEALTIPHVLAACGIQQAVLIGHSDGGTLALLAAANYPAAIAAAITIGAHVFVEDVTLAGIQEAQAHYATTDLPQRLARYHGANTEAVFRAWADTWLRPDFRHWTIEHYLPLVKCPVLVLQGEQDEYGTEAQVAAIAQQVSGPVQASLLTKLGHTPHRQDPAQVLTLISAFVQILVK